MYKRTTSYLQNCTRSYPYNKRTLLAATRPQFSSFQCYLAVWSNILAITVSNNFLYKPIILESYKFLPIYIYTIRIDLISKYHVLIFKVNKNNS